MLSPQHATEGNSEEFCSYTEVQVQNHRQTANVKTDAMKTSSAVCIYTSPHSKIQSAPLLEGLHIEFESTVSHIQRSSRGDGMGDGFARREATKIVPASLKASSDFSVEKR